MIGATQETGLQANSIIDTMYEGYVSRSVAVWHLVILHVRHVYVLLPLARPHVRHVCMLLPVVMSHVRPTHLGLHTVVSLKGRTTSI